MRVSADATRGPQIKPIAKIVPGVEARARGLVLSGDAVHVAPR